MLDREVVEIAEKVAELLVAKNATVAVSDAACGGLIGAYLVAVPGASKFFVGSRTAYTVKSRLTLSGWSQDEINSYTGPSEEVAARMGRRLRLELGATYVLAETGWAGPSADENGQVGSVYLSVAGPTGTVSKKASTGLQDRLENMAAFARLALEYLLEQLSAST
ncbi:CinA-like protein [Wickerhamiella sorbophila]|uniref:CinA-like protein n=1 Tax=Wickerhamiella sorbophila TaxID=45607 RepID=A0A2T0FLN7_9ASCO|nr:CinA-like protein [Wickerhamiella sorbophila]PRT55890.1 CinA-like protein [Wickerhamiella sorbophila]